MDDRANSTALTETSSLTSLEVSGDLVEEMAEDETRAYDDHPPTILDQTYVIPESMTSADASIDYDCI